MAFRFSSTAFCFPRNSRKSIYGEKYTKFRYSSFVFFATRSPSFVILAKQYLHLTQHHLPPATLGSHRRHNRLNRSPYSRHDTSHQSSTLPHHLTLFPIFLHCKKIPRHITPCLYSIFYPADALQPDNKISAHLHRLHK
jgi:hypothetical protein